MTAALQSALMATQTDLRLVSITDGPQRAAEVVRYDRSVYDQRPGPVRRSTPAAPAIPGTAFPVFLDLPRLLSAHVPHRPLVAITADPWPGEIAVWRATSSLALSYKKLVSVASRAGMGALASDLPAGPVGLFDRGSVLELLIDNDLLAGVGDDELFAGANSFAVEAAPGEWEILQGADVTLVGSGHYRITRLLRGQRGTEWAMGDPAPAGARVVVLDDRLAEVPIEITEIGADWTWRVGPADKTYTDPTFVEVVFKPQGEGLQCFAPANPRLARDPATGDLQLSWIRRDRDPAADGWETAVPLSEAAEEYELEILSLDGATVLRTITGLTAPAYTYTAADQTADYGSTVSTMRVRIYQIGALGRGHPLDTTLTASKTI